MRRAGLISSGALAILAAMAIAVLIAVCSSESPAGSEDNKMAPGLEGAGAARADSDSFELGGESGIGEPSAGVAAIGDDAAAGGDGSLPLPQLVDRKIIRTATLELEVEDVGGAVQKVESVAVAAGGFVSQPHVATA